MTITKNGKVYYLDYDYDTELDKIAREYNTDKLNRELRQNLLN